MISSSRKIRRVTENLKLGSLIVWLWVSCILVTLVSSQEFHTNGRFGKRRDVHSLPSFHINSRFGRSEGSSGKSSKGAPKLFEIVPRMDRFFYGSRYGKRSSSPSAPIAIEQPQQQQQRRASEIDSETLDFKRFETALDLDRMRQAAAARQDFDSVEDDNSYRSERLEDDEGSPYRFLCDGCNGRCC